MTWHGGTFGHELPLILELSQHLESIVFSVGHNVAMSQCAMLPMYASSGFPLSRGTTTSGTAMQLLGADNFELPELFVIR